MMMEKNQKTKKSVIYSCEKDFIKEEIIVLGKNQFINYINTQKILEQSGQQ